MAHKLFNYFWLFFKQIVIGVLKYAAFTIKHIFKRLHFRKNKRGFILFFYAFSYLVILRSSWYFSTFSDIGFWIISHLALLCFSVMSEIIIKPRFLFNLRVFLKHRGFCSYCFSKDVSLVFNTKLCCHVYSIQGYCGR